MLLEIRSITILVKLLSNYTRYSVDYWGEGVT